MVVTDNEVRICEMAERVLGSEGERVWSDELVTLGLYENGGDREVVMERVDKFVSDVERDGFTVPRLGNVTSRSCCPECALPQS